MSFINYSLVSLIDVARREYFFNKQTAYILNLNNNIFVFYFLFYSFDLVYL